MAPEHVVKLEFIHSPIWNKLPDHWWCLQITTACSALPKMLLLKPSLNGFALWMDPLSRWKSPGWTWFGTMLRWVARVKVTSTWMAGEKVPQQNICLLLPMMHLGPMRKAHRSTRPGQLPPLLDGPDWCASMYCAFWHTSIIARKNLFSPLSSSRSSVGSNQDQPSIPPHIYERRSY